MNSEQRLAEMLAGVVPIAALGTRPRDPAGVVHRGDPRYRALTQGINRRFTADPEYIAMISSPEEADQVVQSAVTAGRRISVRSGGHCLSDFVSNPEVQAILDVSQMNAIAYDPALGAISIEAGAQLLYVYENLYKRWGVTIPGGFCHGIGLGGHVVGGGHGLLSRLHGLACDHLYAVEVVVVDGSGQVERVVATREETDPNRELWWAHTGGGGGNFGLVTRYWFRSPGASDTGPGALLVSPPENVLVSLLEIPWDDLTEAAFARVVQNYASWHAQHSAPGIPEAGLASVFTVGHRARGALALLTQMDASAPNARGILDGYVGTILAGTGATVRPVPGFEDPIELPWLRATRMITTSDVGMMNPTYRAAHKSAFASGTFSKLQLEVLYRYLSSSDYSNPNTWVTFISYGGQINAVPSRATASAQRSSTFTMYLETYWGDAADDALHVGWMRRFYKDLFAETGGVPAPDGCYINCPDNDLADPGWNTSGVPWSTLYYQDNYPRLRAVKRQWDPSNVFRHRLSIDPA